MERTILKILLADDVAANRRAMKRLLSRRGCDISLASNGQDALEQLANNQFDVILLDLQMPVMDGYQTVRAIRESEDLMTGSTLVIAMSARGSDSDRHQCLALGFSACVPKPVDLDELFAVIDQLRQADFQSVAHSTRHVSFEPGIHLPSHPDPCEKILDREETLRRIQGDQTILALFERQFEAQVASILTAIEAAGRDGELKQIVYESHRLRGIAGNLGAKRLHRVAGDIERAGQASDLVTAKAHIGLLPEAIDDVRRELPRQSGSERAV